LGAKLTAGVAADRAGGGAAFSKVRRHLQRGRVAAADLRLALICEWLTSTTHRPLTKKAGHKRSTTMSIFGNIMSAIFKSARPAATTTAPPSAQPGTTATATMAQVDVAAVMTKLAEQNTERLDWRRSIVDLMKLLNLDSSLAARKQLAQELRFGGDMNDSASMNVWLHKQVMQKLAENGGKVPAELKT
jgi:uncharacterized protein DUF3597